MNSLANAVHRTAFVAGALCAALLLAGCVENPALSESRSLMVQGMPDQSVARLEQGMRDDPSNKELRAQYFRQRDLVTAQLVAQAQGEMNAGQLDAAEATLSRVQKMDANSPRLRNGQAEIAVRRRMDTLLRDADTLQAKGDAAGAERTLRNILSQFPRHPQATQRLLLLRESQARVPDTVSSLKALFSKPITLEFRDTPLRTVFEVIARSSGINFVFDKDVRADNKVTIFIRNADIDEIMRLILATNQLERKLLSENSVLIYPNTAAKTKDYQELVTRSFYLANADVKQAQALIKALVKTKDTFIDEKLNLLMIKDTPQAVQMAAGLLESLDMAEPEVMLDVEVLEVTRSKLQELGLRFPDQIGYGLLQPSTTTTTLNGNFAQTNTNLGGTLAPGYVDLRNTTSLTTFVSNPAITLNLKNQIGDGNTLANPRIRVKNREKAKIHIGDKLPVFTTTSAANVGVSASVSYLDVGLKLDVEPNVSLDDEVSIKVGLEVSSVVREVAGPSASLAYQIGTRSASTVLRLKNGETQVLAGLISDEERSTSNRIPGLGDIPAVGRLFGSQKDDNNKTEIVLLITPRIVRNVVRPESSATAVPAGSESSVGAAPLTVSKTPPRSLSLSTKPAGGAAPAPAARAASLPQQEATEDAPVSPPDVPAPTPAPVPVPVPPAAFNAPIPGITP
jgi:general secretion pathway protein D